MHVRKSKQVIYTLNDEFLEQVSEFTHLGTDEELEGRRAIGKVVE